MENRAALEKRAARLRSLAGASVIGLALALPQPAVAQTLMEALVSAYETNPTLLAERADLRATDENVPQAKAGWRPTVTVEGTYGIQDTNSKTTNNGFINRTDSSTEPYTVQGQVIQPLYRGGRTMAQTRQARALVGQGQANLLTVEQNVLLDAVTAYFDVIREKAVLDLRLNNVEVLRRQLRAAQDRFRVGEITRTDVAQAEARLSGARAEVTSAEAFLTRSREDYARVIGVVPEDLETAPPLPILPESEEGALAIAVDINPLLLTARQRERASFQAIRVVRGELLPTVSLNGTLSQSEDNNSDSSQNNQASLLGSVSVPLYQSGDVYSRVRQAKQTNSGDRLQISEAQRQVEADVANAWESLRAARAVIVSTSEQVRANTIAFEGVQQEARVGSRTTLDVLDAEQELLDAKVSLVEAQRDEYVAAYSLLAAIGGLTAEGIGLSTAVYDPTENFERVRNKFIGTGIGE
ncbi:MAG: TolC family outer membrane protein [Pseudomonadota bacterium]